MNMLLLEPIVNQRILSENSGCSSGAVKHIISNLCADGSLDSNISSKSKAKEEIQKKKPRNAIILAAEYEMRMVPINSL